MSGRRRCTPSCRRWVSSTITSRAAPCGAGRNTRESWTPRDLLSLADVERAQRRARRGHVAIAIDHRVPAAAPRPDRVAEDAGAQGEVLLAALGHVDRAPGRGLHVQPV